MLHMYGIPLRLNLENVTQNPKLSKKEGHYTKLICVAPRMQKDVFNNRGFSYVFLR